MRKRGLCLLLLVASVFIWVLCLNPLSSQEMNYEQFFEYRKEARRNMTMDGWHPREVPWWYDALSQKVKGWDTVLTEHYAVHTNIGLNKTYYLVSQVERMTNVYTDIFEKEFGLPPVAEHLLPATIQVFGSKKSWDEYKRATSSIPAWAEGYVERIFEEVVCCAEIKDIEGKVFHECFHHWLLSYLGFHFGDKDPPNWLNEGLAEYFETMILGKGGRPILGSKCAWLPGLKKKIKKGEIRSLKEIIKTHRNWECDESWGIAHFLMHSRGGERRPLIGAYIKRLMQGENYIRAFNAVFGSDYASLENEWKQYILSLRG